MAKLRIRIADKGAVKGRGLIILALWALTGCYSPAAHSYAFGKLLVKPIECVPYARNVSGIHIYGNAYQWWDRALPHYERGKAPVKGSVLVLSKTQRLRYGHVAVVEKVLDRRQIEVTHVNWGRDWMTRRTVYEGMRVKDVSPKNDWSELRFWSPEEGGFGRIYPASGFVYNKRAADQLALAYPSNSR